MGFTASLFFGRAAFAGAPAAAQDQARMAIIVGSLIAMLAGAVVLVRAKGLRRAQADEQRG
jgi:Na+/H+ antiporter NhaA